MKRVSTTCIFLCVLSICYSQHKKGNTFKINTVAFYNLENMLDTIDNPTTKDEYSPILQLKMGKSEAYTQKIDNMAKVISQIGLKKTGKPPAIIGICEIENDTIIKDLLNSKYLKKYQYNYVHQESPDWRGIDVALLYRETVFSPADYKTYELKAWNSKGFRIKTRSQLLVSGYLENEYIHIIVNHWPSQRGGATKTNYLRILSAELNRKIMKEIRDEDSEAKIIIMGDFNDNPTAESFKEVLQTNSKSDSITKKKLFNPFERMYQKGIGSLGFRDNINLFDQIVLSENLVTKTQDYSSYRFYKAGIFNPQYLITKKGRYKGYPFRSWNMDAGFTGGYSDHYPVYIYLIKALKP